MVRSMRPRTPATRPLGSLPGQFSRPTQRLITLVQLESQPAKDFYPGHLTPKTHALILDWCRRYGLLGVLLSRWESIGLAPQFDGGGWTQSEILPRVWSAAGS